MRIASMTTEQNPSALADSRATRARALSALGDETRLGVMELLAVQDLSPDALAAALEVPGNLLAHHLKVLEAAGLVMRRHSQHDRRRTYVHAVEGSLDGLLPESGSLTASRVVFVCTHNSARSVLAEALWREASTVPAASAGTHPANAINPKARTTARRWGIDVTEKVPQLIDDVVRPGDVVISVCDAVNEELPLLDNPRVHWSIPDPATVGTDAAFDDAVRALRDRVVHLAPRVRRETHTRARSRQP